MSSIFLLLVLVVVVIAVLALLKAKSNGGSGGNEIWPFYAKKPLSQPEQVLYFRLIEALPDHIILAQVQLSRFLGVKKGHKSQSWLNRINRMSADFVVCNKDSSIVAVIELDDATHQKPDRQQKSKSFAGKLRLCLMFLLLKQRYCPTHHSSGTPNGAP
jgi:Protein of unknown function (DUF2726)